MKVITFCLIAALSTGTAYAQAPAEEECNEPVFPQSFPAGVGCTFAYTIVGCEVKDLKQIGDRLVQAGRAAKLIVTNDDTGVTKVLHPRGGSLVRYIPQDNGTTRSIATGVNLVTLFPTDTPPGPSSTLYQGRVDINIDTAGNWTVEKADGRATDVCALLGG